MTKLAVDGKNNVLTEETKVKKFTKIVSLILTVLMLTMAVCIVPANAAEPVYKVVPVMYVDGTLVVNVYLSGVKASVGHIALDYSDDFQKGGADFASTIIGLGVTVVGANNAYGTAGVGTVEESVLLKDGRVAFSWVVDPSTGKTAIDATTEDKLIAAVHLKSVMPAYMITEAKVVGEATDVSDIAGFLGETSLVQKSDLTREKGVECAELPKLTGVKATKGDKYARIQWTQPAASTNINGVLVYNDTTTELTTVAFGADRKTNSYKWEGLTNGTEYNFIVIPIVGNIDGIPKQIGVASAPLKVTPSRSSSGAVVVAGATEYEIEFEAGEGEFESGKTKEKITVKSGGKITSSDLPNIVAPEGKKFVGWTEDGKTVINLDTYRVNSNTVLKPLFEEAEVAQADYHNAYLSGYEDKTVKPNNYITRAEVTALISRISEKYDSNAEYIVEFDDVKEDAWYAQYVGFCAEVEVVNGYPNGEFMPDKNIKRAEFVAMIVRMLDLDIKDAEAFKDVDDAHWASDYIKTLKFNKIIDGYTDGTFRPEQFITRAEAVKIINRAIDRTPSKENLDKYVEDEGIPFTDLKADFWGFYDMMEATVTHKISDYHAE